MFVLRHVPTGTLYALSCDARRGLYHRLVCFDRQEDAVRVANSLATYKHVHQSFPRPSNHVFVLPAQRLSRQAIQEDLQLDWKEPADDLLTWASANELAVLLVTEVTEASAIRYRAFDRRGGMDIEAWNRRLR